MSLTGGSKFILTGGANYQIARSLRFRASNSNRLTRTYTATGNAQKWTASFWCKRSGLTSSPYGLDIMGAQNTAAQTWDTFGFDTTDAFSVRFDPGTTPYSVITTAFFRDPSAFYNIIVALDSTQATAANRCRIYFNNVEQTLSTNTLPQNYSSRFNVNTNTAGIGTSVNYASTTGPNHPFDGYLSEVNFIDGQQLTPSSFGQTDATTGAWTPIKYTGTYGTNGFYLNFSDNSGVTFDTIGADNAAGSYSRNLRSSGSSIGGLTAVGGLAAVFDGSTVHTSANGAQNSSIASGYVLNNSAGRDWGSGVTKTVTAFVARAVSDSPFLGTGAVGWKLQGSTDNFSSSTVDLASGTSGGASGEVLVVTSGITTTTAYRYHRIVFNGNGVNHIRLGQLELYEAGLFGINHWQPTNISVTAGVTNDSLVDTPTNYGSDTGVGGEVRGNYCTLNPIDKNANLTLSEGNLTAIPASTADYWLGRATMALPTTGKWYWELTLNNTPYLYQAGIYSGNRPMNGAISATGNEYQVGWGTAYSYINFQSNNAALASWSTNTNPTNGDVLGFAYDASNDSMWVSRNGTFYNTSGTANPATNTDPRFTSIPKGLFPGVNLPNPASGGVTMNFGQRPWVNAAPSGFKALCTQNLPTPAIAKPSSYFDVALLTGIGAAADFPQAVQSPDLYFLKDRSGVSNWQIGDTSRTNGNNLHSNSTAAEVSNPSAYFSGTTIGMQPYDADGGQNAHAYVAAQWKKGATPGFDIVSYTGNGTARTISHALGVVPSMMLVFNRAGSNAWRVYHKANGAAGSVYLNLTSAYSADAGDWNSTSPTSAVFSVGASTGSNNSGSAMIAYLFAEVAGFSKFGSYTGNGSADGTFVYCGFRPRWILIKRTDTTGAWVMFDTARDSYNVSVNSLVPSATSAESSTNSTFDFLSNGFKPRNTDSTGNGSSVPYIFAAFAEAPFKTARAR